MPALKYVLIVGVIYCMKITVFFYHSKYFFIFLKRRVLFTAAATQCRMTEWKYVEPVVANLGALGVTRKSEKFYVDKWKGDRILRGGVLTSEKFLIETFGCL